MEADPAYRPFMTVNERSNEIAVSMRDDMLRLPSETVDLLIEFYSYDTEVNSVMKNILSDAYAALPPDRKRQVIDVFVDVLDEMIASGTRSLRSIDEFLAAGRRGFVSARLNDAAVRVMPGIRSVTRWIRSKLTGS